ncbi:MAG: shikimate dehydrogenase [Eubacteriales bacterium]|nr:shikimate dehydrogenase [Eubacteriales bacterium]MDD3349495.1 shikimate dehydrogenase [Eubacteriales bacterium]
MKFAVIGSPISHSLSPDMHLPVLSAFDPEASYEKIFVEKGELPAFLEKVKKERFRGFNLTMPHKTDILPYLTEIEQEAKIFGSVNTVVNRKGRLCGYNTDGKGFLLSLMENGRSLKNEKLLILGAGGVARTIALKAALDGATTVIILARMPQKAAALCREIQKLGERVKGVRIGYGRDEQAPFFATDTTILVNATPRGMEGTESEFEDFSFLDALPKNALVYDLIYEPAETKLIREAKKRGLQTQNGLKMLKYQAILADRLFLDRETDSDEMCLCKA